MIRLLETLGDLPIFSVCQTLAVLSIGQAWVNFEIRPLGCKGVVQIRLKQPRSESVEHLVRAELKEGSLEKQLRFVITFGRVTEETFWKAFSDRLTPCVPKVRLPPVSHCTALLMRCSLHRAEESQAVSCWTPWEPPLQHHLHSTGSNNEYVSSTISVRGTR